MRLGGWKTASFLVGSESNVRHWGPWQEVITSSKGKKQEARNKKQETRNKKQEARNKKPEEEDPSLQQRLAAWKLVSSRFKKATGPRKRRWDAMVFSCFGSGRQSWQLQASKASFLVGSESDVRHWHRGLGSAVGTGMPLLVGSESDVWLCLG